MRKVTSDCLRATTCLIISMLVTSCHQKAEMVNTCSLLKEMTDLSRLAELPDHAYRTVQFSSYDRRSTNPDSPFWFANEDGFGNEPLPGFEKVLTEPDQDGIGEYLVCDLKGPGAIVRLWTAGINGNVRLFLDDMDIPVFEGSAEDFFWNTLETLSGNETIMDSLQAFRQFDAVYFPIPFADRCRIVWTGKIREIHFYHVGARLYDPGIDVETFHCDSFSSYLPVLKRINLELLDSRHSEDGKKQQLHQVNLDIPATAIAELFSQEGPAAIHEISLKVTAKVEESVLRQNMIRIYFDGSPVPQVQSPLGDFFGAAPGINPYHSFPVSVEMDSTFVCRFVMPYKHDARIEIENTSGDEIGITGGVTSAPYAWDDASSMHFNAQWMMDHGLTAQSYNEQNSKIEDILYAATEGSGRIVGAAAFLYNPSNVPTSWGNWWGEGDEKIFVDQDTFPSFFGTGSEDYFNYSWSSARLFSYAYCGQPRNDGPGNRGYVSNFRWHILDDIPFQEKVSFFMELGHHGRVPGFSYGRMVYYYALPGNTDRVHQIRPDDLREITYQDWYPEAYAGSAGFDFIQAEDLISQGLNLALERGNIYAGKSILMWKPAGKGEKISFMVRAEKTGVPTRIGLSLSHSPEGGKASVLINGSLVKFRGKEVIDLHEKLEILDNHLSEQVILHPGDNEIVLVSLDELPNKQIGIDFVWMPIKDD